MIRNFSSIQGSHRHDPTQDVSMMGDDNVIEIIDLNWSSDGTMVAAGQEKSLVVLDMKKILSQSVEALLMESNKQLEVDASSLSNEK